MHRQFSRLLATAAALAFLAACGGDESAEKSVGTVVSEAATESSSANEADLTFVHEMIGHHEQAVSMADMALAAGSGARPEITALAGRIKAAQQPEIDLMRGWLEAWGEAHDESSDSASSMEGMDHSSGMMTDEEMAALTSATGSEFDQQWLTLMIKHHRGAVSSALIVQQDGVNPDVRTLADGVVTAQNAEIEELTTLLGA